MFRSALLLFLLAAPALADGETRLGSLIRWYLNEPRPSRREDLLESIERLADVRQVSDAIRRGEHFEHRAKPVLRRDGPEPVFSLARARIQDLSASAGRYARLTLPQGYDPKRLHPLVLDVGPTRVAVPPEAVHLAVTPEAHAGARETPWAAEALVLSLLAHGFELCAIDPDRVFLRAEGGYARLAWFIALHNPDRFAGVLAAQDLWKEAERLAENAAFFSALLIERRRGDRRATRFFGKIRKFNRDHVHLRAPAEASDDKQLLPALESWWRSTRRRRVTGDLTILCDRAPAQRVFWARLAPKATSLKQEDLGRRGYTHRGMRNPARLTVRIDRNEANTVRVTTKRVSAFTLYIDPRVFDTKIPLRISINGGIPESRIIDPEIAALLEDYAERRDPALLYVRRVTLKGR